MQLASFATRTMCRSLASCILFVALVLGRADFTLAQSAGAKSAPIAIRNNTNTSLTVHFRSIENDFGTYQPMNLSMVVPAGQYLWLVDVNNSKVFAKRYDYTVNTPGRSSQWTAALNRTDPSGYFDISFTPTNLRAHLGEQPEIPDFPLPPLAGPGVQMPDLGGNSGPSRERTTSAAIKIAIASVTHRAAKQILDNPNSTFAQQLAAAAVLGIRDGLIRSTLDDLFPGLTGGQKADIQLLISDAADGRLGLFTQDQQQAKSRLITLVNQRNPNAGNAAAIADFVWFVHQNRR